MTNNALVPRTQIKHGVQTALLISRYPSVGWLKGNPMPAVITAPEKLAASLPQKTACITVLGASVSFEAEESYSTELDVR